jgi:hypothetical protein
MSGETMEQSYAVVDTATAKVVNVVVWDGVQDYQPGEGLEMVVLDGPGGIDWDYVDGEFVDNRPVEEFPA